VLDFYLAIERKKIYDDYLKELLGKYDVEINNKFLPININSK